MASYGERVTRRVRGQGRHLDTNGALDTAHAVGAGSVAAGGAAQRRRLEGAFREAPVGMFLSSTGRDSTGRFISVNHAYCDLTGYSEEQLLERSVQSITHPDDLDDSIEAMRALMAGEVETMRIEKRYMRPDGTTVWADLNMSVARDREGEPQFCITQALDITERRRDEEALRHAENHMTEAFEHGPLGMVLMTMEGDVPGPFVRANQAFCRMTGFEERELIGSDFRMVAHESEVAGVLAEVRRLVSGEIATIEHEYRYVRAEGNSGWLQVSASLAPNENGDERPQFLIAQVQEVSDRRQTQDELVRTLSMHAATLESTADGLLVVDEQGRMISFNRQFVEMWGIPDEVLDARDDDRALSYVLDQVLDPEEFLKGVRDLYERPMAESYDVLHFKDGRIFERYSKPHLVNDEAAGRVWSFRDATERRRAEQHHREAEERYRSLVERLPAITYVTEPHVNGAWLYVSPQIHSILGYTVEEWKRDPSLWSSSIHPEDRGAATEADRRSVESGEFSLDYRMFTRDGELIWFHDEGVAMVHPSGQGTVLHGFMLDITERKRSEDRIAYLAYHDGLTGLPNRAMFQEHLELAVARARRHQRAVAVLYMDLDRFKLVNDSFGHAPGDELLRQIADRLRGVTRDDDLVARHSGDEFLVMLADIEPDAVGDQASGKVARGAEAVSVKIHEALRAPFVIEGEEFYIDASIGIGIFPTDAQDADTLIRHADMAMYESKRLGQGGTQLYALTGANDAASQLTLASRLRRATERGEFVMLYQPVVDLETCRMGGVEALIRWRDPKRGAIMPMEFIPLAEETGLIEEIGEWVIEEVCEQVAIWERAGIDLRAAFNVSLRQLRRPDFAQRVMDLAGAAGANPRRLVAEITESAVMRDPEQARQTFERLHEFGVWTAIDDFGTGHSSLSRLMDVPVSALKIDRSFVSRVPDDPAAAAMVAGIVQIAKGLKLVPVAEGIETEEQRKFLVEAGCTRGQGFRFSRAVTPEEIVYLHERGPLGPPARPIARREPRRGFSRLAAAAKRPDA